MSIPEKLGRYEVRREIGTGGMAVVYEAVDPVIDRRVAIKVLRSDLAVDAEGLRELEKRFEREFRSAGALSHPGIVTIHDVGHEGGSPFIAMEYVGGGALDELIDREGPLPADRVEPVVSQAAAALDYAHDRGVVHRDVKPGNLLLTSSGRVKVTDFGIAKLEDLSMTRTGVAVGTPAYMSPEQVTASPVSGRSDQFALANIAYEMLTRSRPFGGDSATAIMYQIVHGDPPPAHEFNEGLPRRIDEVLRKALAKDPEDRYETCTGFAEDLGEELRRVTRSEPEATVLLDAPVTDHEREDVGEPGPGAGPEPAPGEPEAGSTAGESAVRATTGPRPVDPGSVPDAEAAGFTERLRASLGVGGDRLRRLPPAARVGTAVGVSLVVVALLLVAFLRAGDESPGLAGSPGDPAVRESIDYRIVSDPAGARLRVDSRTVEGRTPARVSLAVDQAHGLTVELPGYEPYEHRIAAAEPYAGDLRVETIHVALRPAGEGFVADADGAAPARSADEEAAGTGDDAPGGDAGEASREAPTAEAREPAADTESGAEEPAAVKRGESDPAEAEPEVGGEPQATRDARAADTGDDVVPLTPEVRRPVLIPESVALELDPEGLEALRSETRTLTLRVLVEDDGSVSDVRFYGIEPEFTPSDGAPEDFAEIVRRSAIEHWRFRPAMKYGYPVRVWFMVRVELAALTGSSGSSPPTV